MIEGAAPSETATVVAPVRHVGGDRIQTSAGSLTDQVHEDFGTDQATDFVACAYSSVVDDDVCLCDVTTRRHEMSAQRREQRAKMFVDRVGVQTIRDHDLDLRWPPCVQSSDDAGVLSGETFAGNRMRNVVVAVPGHSSDANAPNRGVADHGLADRRVKRRARMT